MCTKVKIKYVILFKKNLHRLLLLKKGNKLVHFVKKKIHFLCYSLDVLNVFKLVFLKACFCSSTNLLFSQFMEALEIHG